MAKEFLRGGRRPYVSQPVQYHASGLVQAAMVTAVVTDDIVNLVVFPDGGQPVPVPRVPRRGAFTPMEGLDLPTWAT